MSLVKCAECRQEISTQAKTCPHCGNPIRIKSKKSPRAILLVLFVGIGILGIYYLPSILNEALNPGAARQARLQKSTAKADESKKIPLQEINNLSYSFYLGQIESPNTTNITDDLKNQITKIVYNSHFSKKLLKNTPIIILNNLALSPDQYIDTPNGKLLVPELKADFLSEGGLYVQFQDGIAIIFINKSTLAQNQLTEVLTHELGHAIGRTLTDQDWKKYYQLRNIIASTTRQGSSWQMSPEEDFAEVYKDVFTGLGVRTYYGFLEPTMGGSENFMSPCSKVYTKVYNAFLDEYRILNKSRKCTGGYMCILNPTAPTEDQQTQAELRTGSSPEVQNCRKDALLNPTKYSDSTIFPGVQYKSTVGPKTKEFISTIANSLNI